jgi:ribose 5-phosphate isomerase A
MQPSDIKRWMKLMAGKSQKKVQIFNMTPFVATMSIRRFSSVLSKAEKAKKWAGQNAIKHVLERKPTIIGLGSGSTIVYAIEHLATTSLAKSAICIPTSFQTRQLILSHQLCLGSIEQ